MDIHVPVPVPAGVHVRVRVHIPVFVSVHVHVHVHIHVHVYVTLFHWSQLFRHGGLMILREKQPGLIILLNDQIFSFFQSALLCQPIYLGPKEGREEETFPEM
jgi:hypothetical protein